MCNRDRSRARARLVVALGRRAAIFSTYIHPASIAPRDRNDRIYGYPPERVIVHTYIRVAENTTGDTRVVQFAAGSSHPDPFPFRLNRRWGNKRESDTRISFTGYSRERYDDKYPVQNTLRFFRL